MHAKRKVVLLTATLASAVLPGCWVYSLHPLSDTKHIVFDPGLIGTWQDNEKDDSLVIPGNSDIRRCVSEGPDQALRVGSVMGRR